MSVDDFFNDHRAIRMSHQAIKSLLDVDPLQLYNTWVVMLNILCVYTDNTPRQFLAFHAENQPPTDEDWHGGIRDHIALEMQFSRESHNGSE